MALQPGQLEPTLIEKYVRHAASIMEKDEVVDRLVAAEVALSKSRAEVRRLNNVGRTRYGLGA
jgi:hypothetical protein